MPESLLIAGALALAAYLLVIGALMALGRWGDARALAGFLPDCVVLLRRLIGDRRVQRARKAVLAATLVYVVLPVDLVPEFIPVVGVLDDVLLVALALRLVLAGAGPAIIAEHWPGPKGSLAVLLRVSLITAGGGKGVRASAVAAGVGALGLWICLWVDVANNCPAAIRCPAERDPILLSSARALAAFLCAAGVVGLAATRARRRGRMSR